MKLRELHLNAFGPFTNRKLDFGSAEQSVVFVHGPNEAGKSSTLRAISDLRFGIPQLSRDNFVHEHRNMQLGGVLIDRNGNHYQITRRKGRNPTLHYADGSAVTPEVEALLTCGLSKEEYEAMFGLDHERLRKGGEALLDGQGEVGAALFEASAGVRSIPMLLDRLDQSARTYFMPGTRGRNGRINEALRSYADNNAVLKSAQIRPAVWAELYKQHHAAKERLAELEERNRDANRRLRRLSELRGVAPLVRSLDAAQDVLTELENVRLLAENAAIERATAQAGAEAARQNARAAEETVRRLRAELTALVLDQAALDTADRIERLAATAESFDTLRNEIVDTANEVTEAQRLLDERAGDILPGTPADVALGLVPAPAARAAIVDLLREFELAQQRLRQHVESARPLTAAEDESVIEALPPLELRTALHAATLEATRKEALMKRKEQLPAEIKALERVIAADMAALGLASEAALLEVRALLDSEIDAARSESETAEAELAALRKHLAQLKGEHSTNLTKREQLLAAGAVPTMTEVRAARERRGATWMQIRGANDDGKTAATVLLDAFDAEVRDADHLVDELTRDTERATQLQNCQDELARLERQSADIVREQADILDRNTTALREWHATLQAQSLPLLAPAALREWQGRLSDTRNQSAALQLLRDELDEARATERDLINSLYGAITALGITAPIDAGLPLLWSLATNIQEEMERREHTLSAAAGKRVERERQIRQFRDQQETLEQQLANVQLAVSSRVYSTLHLEQDAGIAAARARLLEFDLLLDAKDELGAATARGVKAQQALERLLDQGRELAQTMGDTLPDNLRVYVEQLETRLTRAKLSESKRALKQQGLNDAQERQHEQESAAQSHEATLERLCCAADVGSPELLPEAEAQSQRKRQAQADADRARKDLAAASSRELEELRALLSEYAERLDEEETQASIELTALEADLSSARQAEEAARHALDGVDSADTAAAARERMECDAAAVRLAMTPWIRSRLAHALLDEALKRFRERAQGPMLRAASCHFQKMTDGQFVRLVSDDTEARPVLLAQRANSSQVKVEGLSEGTRDQLYLALRLAALELRREAGYDLPVVLDDVLMTSDDGRAALALHAIAEFAKGHQVILFTHHAHLLDVAERTVPGEMLQVVGL